ncbi:NAD-dependent epimerase/dehydratase family protein [Nocardioides agariphilus]|uniref:NAD-dependent epimerase/dehydratase family protein n=1 Tax=Nocardioides agariphilus TaxID=433664 RepID=A0A930VSD5_9ACTN|nr:NAD-dependent epimerase/dehydratase family protein [Nocardioides agariphilus]MBF4770123.1 NAD-dependent epimerase/dehydratase family protein [Nocardioides agariphilus]
MRILVLGGSVFLSRAVAADAVARGHDVTCVTRGRSGAVPEGARHVTWDRSDDVPPELAAENFEAVVDVSRTPSHVRTAVAAWPTAHWVFVSTVNVYADNATPDPGTDGPLVEAIDEDRDLKEHPEAYGPMKVSCERSVLAGAARSMVVRPGLIVGPGDPTGRYGYWPERLAEGGRVLALADPESRVQFIDVRDLAEWIVRSVEDGTTGVYDGIGPATPAGEVLAQTGAGVGADVELVWTGQEFLAEQEVEPWAGDGALPMWLPRPEYDGMLTHRFDLSAAAGLTVRPFDETARDTLTWLRENPDAPRTGMSREREAELLAAWDAR